MVCIEIQLLRAYVLQLCLGSPHGVCDHAVILKSFATVI